MRWESTQTAEYICSVSMGRRVKRWWSWTKNTRKRQTKNNSEGRIRREEKKRGREWVECKTRIEEEEVCTVRGKPQSEGDPEIRWRWKCYWQWTNPAEGRGLRAPACDWPAWRHCPSNAWLALAWSGSGWLEGLATTHVKWRLLSMDGDTSYGSTRYSTHC